VRVTELDNGFPLLVGRDLEERRRLFGIVAKAAQWSLLVVIVLGLGGGIFVARRVLQRIDAMTGTTQRIMAGDLSGPLPVGRSGDELDRLAENLNAMLERIEALMMGLKEVSDNIAHDLKTPLTRCATAPRRRWRVPAARPNTARAGTHHRGIRRPDPHLQRAVDDRARRVRAGARQHG
jgi:methyl-accepting chemotaxis protein